MSQYNHAVAIVAACKRRGLPVRGAHVALETAMTESSLWMYANGNNRRSLQLPHDRVGWDHGSVGLFQQQVGGAPHSTANWGTTDELMDVATSTEKFLDALGPLSRWQTKTNWMACQDVQHSRFSDGSNYKANDARAIQIGNALWGVSPSTPSSTGTGPGVTTSGSYTVLPGDTLSTIAQKTGTTVAQLVALNQGSHPSLAHNPNLIEVGWQLRLTGAAQSGPKTPPKPPQRTYVVQSGDNLTSIAQKTGTTVAQLVALNQGSHPSLAHNPNLIEVGWQLRLTGAAQSGPKTPPKPPQRTYVVQSGDNLTSIARLFDDPRITWQSIAQANHLANPNLIRPGDKLVIA